MKRGIALYLLLVLMLVGIVWFIHYGAAAKSSTPQIPEIIKGKEQYEHAQKIVKANRIVDDCGHEVVCGGVPTLDAFEKIRASNTEVAELYSALLEHVYITKLGVDTWSYDSYRIGDKIFWTKEKKLIRAGEYIITDGHWAILMRCGNMISLEPQTPTENTVPPNDIYPPTIDDFPAPIPDSPVEHTDIHPAPPTNVMAEMPPTYGGTSFVPVFTPGGGGTIIPPNTPIVPGVPVSVPESSSLSCLIVGLGILGGIKLWRRSAV